MKDLTDFEKLSVKIARFKDLRLSTDYRKKSCRY